MDVSSRTALWGLIGLLTLALMSNPSQAGICDPLSHLGRTCQEGDHILAPGGKQKYSKVMRVSYGVLRTWTLSGDDDQWRNFRVRPQFSKLSGW